MKKELKESLMEAADKNCDVCGGRGVFNRQDGPEDFEAVPCVCVLCKNCGNYPCDCDAQVDAYREQNGAV